MSILGTVEASYRRQQLTRLRVLLAGDGKRLSQAMSSQTEVNKRPTTRGEDAAGQQ